MKAALILLVTLLGFASAQNNFFTSRKVVASDLSLQRPQIFPSSGDGVYRKAYKPVAYKPVAYKPVKETSYKSSNEGSYVADNAGAYNKNDGRYYADNGGQYVHSDSGYNHDDQGYKHDDQGYKHQNEKYAQDSDKYKNTGDRFSNAGGVGFDAQNKKPVVVTVVAVDTNNNNGDKVKKVVVPKVVTATGGLAKFDKFGSGQQYGQFNRFGSEQENDGQFGSGTGFGAPVALEQGSASGKYENRFYGIVRKEQHAEEDGYHYLYETENGILAEEQGRLENRASDAEGMRASGFYTYTGPDNVVYTVKYTADENGFVPEGVHIPTPPPVPAAIVRALEYQRSIGTL